VIFGALVSDSGDERRRGTFRCHAAKRIESGLQADVSRLGLPAVIRLYLARRPRSLRRARHLAGVDGSSSRARLTTPSPRKMSIPSIREDDDDGKGGSRLRATWRCA
jgi:hypothetical protein